MRTKTETSLLPLAPVSALAQSGLGELVPTEYLNFLEYRDLNITHSQRVLYLWGLRNVGVESLCRRLLCTDLQTNKGSSRTQNPCLALGLGYLGPAMN